MRKPATKLTHVFCVSVVFWCSFVCAPSVHVHSLVCAVGAFCHSNMAHTPLTALLLRLKNSNKSATSILATMVHAVSNGATNASPQSENYLFNEHLQRRIDIPCRHKFSMLDDWCVMSRASRSTIFKTRSTIFKKKNYI